jgi:hypothetical protein
MMKLVQHRGLSQPDQYHLLHNFDTPSILLRYNPVYSSNVQRMYIDCVLMDIRGWQREGPVMGPFQ